MAVPTRDRQWRPGGGPPPPGQSIGQPRPDPYTGIRPPQGQNTSPQTPVWQTRTSTAWTATKAADANRLSQTAQQTLLRYNSLLGRLEQTTNTPLTFDNSPAIRDQPIIQPSTSPVDVPGAREATGPLQATGTSRFLRTSASIWPHSFHRPAPGNRPRRFLGA